MSNPNFGPRGMGPERPSNLELNFSLNLNAGPLGFSYDTGAGIRDLRFTWDGEQQALAVQTNLARGAMRAFPLLGPLFPHNISQARALLAQIAPMRAEIEARRSDLGVHTVYPLALSMLNELRHRAQQLLPPPAPSALFAAQAAGVAAA